MERAIIANRKHDKGEVRKEMSERKMKRVEDSLTEQSHLLMPKCLNAAGYLFGGQLLAWIDETAGIVAKRHAEMNVVTVAVDNMYFKAGARVNDTIVLIGRLTHVGRSSMEVRIDTYCEALDGTRTMINRAYFIMVGTCKTLESTQTGRILTKQPQMRLFLFISNIYCKVRIP